MPSAKRTGCTDWFGGANHSWILLVYWNWLLAGRVATGESLPSAMD